MLEFTVHHILSQAILGYTISQHASWLRLHFKNLTVMAFEREIVRAGKASRAGAYNSDLLTSRWILNEWNRRIEQAGLGRMSMHTADSDFFFDEPTPASLLAWRRACQAQNIWERQHFLDQARRLFHRPLSNQFQITRNIDMRRTIYLTWWLAVRIVVGQQHLQVSATNVKQFIRFCSDHHSWKGRRCTRRQRLSHALDVYQAHTTRSSRLQLLIITHI